MPGRKSRGSGAERSLEWKKILPLLKMAIEEDVGEADFSTRWTIGPRETGQGTIVFKENAIVAGLDVAARVWNLLDEKVVFSKKFDDGERVRAGTAVAGVSGRLRSLLTGERTALNFLQRLSGIASTTSRFVERVKGSGTRILDTRKTAPGSRLLDKYAVRIGGGFNHRFGLYDMILIKDNHQILPGGIEAALEKVRKNNRKRRLPVEVEVKDLDEFRRIIDHPVDRIMLDNMSVGQMRECVRLQRERGKKRKRPLLEASGNISLQNVRAVALTGVDLISVGALTHSVHAVDISFEIRGPE